MRRIIGGVLTVGILLAVPALGLVHLGSDLLASWQSQRVDQAVAAPWTFDAPASTVAQVNAAPRGGAALPVDMALLLEEWRATNLIDDLVGSQEMFNSTLINLELRLDLFLFLSGQNQTLQNVLFQQLFFNFAMNQQFLTQLNIVNQHLSASPSS